MLVGRLREREGEGVSEGESEVRRGEGVRYLVCEREREKGSVR